MLRTLELCVIFIKYYVCIFVGENLYISLHVSEKTCLSIYKILTAELN